ncbi:MAG: hypothetical protein AAFP16_00125 [Pseudomonadota bacterium]
MPLRIQKQFIATVAAAAIAVTGISAAPARAGDDDVGRALATILGLAIVGAVIADSRNDKASAPVYHGNNYRVYPGHPKPRPLPPRVGRKLLPQDCLYSFKTRGGRTAKVFGQRCLNRSYHHANSLPRACARQIDTRQGRRYGYGAKCLSNHGYKLARR